jgi:hypothetical protein
MNQQVCTVEVQEYVNKNYLAAFPSFFQAQHLPYFAKKHPAGSISHSTVNL